VLLRLCSQNYKVLIEELQGFSNLNCKEVLELIEERRVFLKSQNREEKEGNWRATPDGSRYYTFGKIMEDDHQTGVLTEKLITELGLSAQRIVRMAISDLYEKQQTEIGKDEIDDFVESTPVEEDLTRDSEDLVDEINWESKQEEFETLWQRDAEESEEYTCSEYLEEPEEVNCDLEDEEIEVEENVTNQTPITDAEILADILRQASDYADVRRGLYQYQPVKKEAREAKSRSKKLEWDGLCVTLRAGSGNRTALRPIHPCEPRVISVREAAR
jgi:site-specific DNA-cytosine methylase